MNYRCIITNFTDKSVRKRNSGQMLLLPARLVHVPLKHPVLQFMDSEEQIITSKNSHPGAQVLGCGSDVTTKPSRVTPCNRSDLCHRGTCTSPCVPCTPSLYPTAELQHSKESWKSQVRFSRLKKSNGIAYLLLLLLLLPFYFNAWTQWRFLVKQNTFSDSQCLSIPAGQTTDPQQELRRSFVDNPNTVFEKMQGWKAYQKLLQSLGDLLS